MSQTGTLAKTKKVGESHPPKDIREKVHQRRAWLAAEMERINAEPNRSAKIVGMGSYQHLSIYETTQVEGRLRHRGVCQWCGNSQVVKDGVLVLHGYNRPGDGYVVGECPGMRKAPLNLDNTLTTQWHAEYKTAARRALAHMNACKAAERDALNRLYHGDKDGEPGAYQARPKAPRKAQPTGADLERWRTETKAYNMACTAWATQYPLTSDYVTAQENLRTAQDTEWKMRTWHEHFTRLLASGVHGTALTPEVVP